MSKFAYNHLTALWLLCTLVFGLQSCDDETTQLDKSKVQFSLSPATSTDGRGKPIDVPENASLRVTVESSTGSPVLSNHEIKILKDGDAYVTDPMDLLPGSYVITDFVIVKDSEVVNATPKSKSPFSSSVLNSLPYAFSVSQGDLAKVSMQVLDARNEKPASFGYTSFKANAMNRISFIASSTKGGQALKGATGELRLGKQVIENFSVKPGMNSIGFEGEPDAVYTLSVYTKDEAKVKTFNMKELKEASPARPFKMALEPALMIKLESGHERTEDYEEFFEFVLGGTDGDVNVNWGDGYENNYTLPVYDAHEYTTGTYTAVITGDLDRITDLHGFAYSTIMSAITGLTNLTGLRTYNPSWGAVPINVDLSNCKMLETIYVEKYGSPYEPIDLRTDFLLPEEHFIREFVFWVPSLDPTRENMTADELEVLVDNIYNNTTRRNIVGGNFIVYPVDAPHPETQEKLDILQNDYNWEVALSSNVWEDASEAGRATHDLDRRREKWLRDKFPNSRHLFKGRKVAVNN